MFRHFIAIGFAAWCGVCSAIGAPISHHKHPTQNSYKTSCYEFVLSAIGPEADERAASLDEDDALRYREILDLYARASVNYGYPVLDMEQLVVDLYPELLELDPDPPLYTQYRATHRSADRDPDSTDADYERLAGDLEQIAIRMEETGYPGYIPGATYIRAAGVLRTSAGHDPEREKELREHGIELLALAARLEGIRPEHQEFVATRIARNAFQYSSLAYEDKIGLIQRILTDPDADHWIAHWAAGELYYKGAWEIRGSGYASSVSDAQWEGFYEQLGKSYRHLVRAWELHPERVEPSSQLISVVMGQQFEEGRHEGFWFEQATNARSDFIQTYEHLAWAMLPRWGGSVEHQRSIISHAIRAGKDNHAMLPCVLSVMSVGTQEQTGNTDMLVEPQYLDAVIEMAQREISDPTPYINRRSRAVSLRTVALGAFRTGDYQTASELLAAGGHEAPHLYKAWSETDRFKDFAPMLANPAYEHIVFMMDAIDNDDLDRARGHLIDAINMLEELQDEGALERSDAPDPIRLMRTRLRTIDRWRAGRTAP